MSCTFPTVPTATYPEPSLAIARTSASANASRSSGTGRQSTPSADRQNRACRSASSGPTEPPARYPSGVAMTVVIRSATPSVPMTGTARDVHARPSGDVHAIGDDPERPTATTSPSRPTAIETGNVNSVVPIGASDQVPPSADVQAVGVQPG